MAACAEGLPEQEARVEREQPGEVQGHVGGEGRGVAVAEHVHVDDEHGGPGEAGGHEAAAAVLTPWSLTGPGAGGDDQQRRERHEEHEVAREGVDQRVGGALHEAEPSEPGGRDGVGQHDQGRGGGRCEEVPPWHGGAAAGAEPGARVAATVAALVDTLAADPPRARLYAESPLRQSLHDRRRAAQGEFADLVLGAVLQAGPERRLDALFVVAGATDVVTRWLLGELDVDRDTLVEGVTAIGVGLL